MIRATAGLLAASAVVLALVCAAGAAPGEVTTLTDTTFDAAVLGDWRPWVVFFNAGSAGDGGAASDLARELATKLAGRVSVGTVDVNEGGKALAGQYGVSGALTPAVLLFRGSSKGKPRPALAYDGEAEFKPLSRWALEAVSGKAVKLLGDDGSAVKQFLYSKPSLPHALVVTPKAAPSSVSRAIANEFRGRVAFGQVASSIGDVAGVYQVTDPEQTTLLLFAATDGKKPKEPTVYDGAKNYASIGAWLESLAPGEPRVPKTDVAGPAQVEGTVTRLGSAADTADAEVKGDEKKEAKKDKDPAAPKSKSKATTPKKKKKKIKSSYVKAVSMETMDAFSTNRKYGIKVLLFTSKQKTSGLYKSLSVEFRGVISFGEIKSSESMLAARFGVTKMPALRAIAGDSRNPFAAMDAYRGAMNRREITEWLNGLVGQYRPRMVKVVERRRLRAAIEAFQPRRRAPELITPTERRAAERVAVAKRTERSEAQQKRVARRFRRLRRLNLRKTIRKEKAISEKRWAKATKKADELRALIPENDVSKKGGGILQLTTARYRKFVESTPRNYSMVVMFKTELPTHHCPGCERARPAFEGMASYYKKHREELMEQGPEIFFAILDIEDGRELFGDNGVQHVPFIFVARPNMHKRAKKPYADDDVMDTRRRFTDHEVVDFVALRTGIDVVMAGELPLAQIAQGGALLALTGILYLIQPKMVRKVGNLLFVIGCTAAVLVGLSGYMFTRIRETALTGDLGHSDWMERYIHMQRGSQFVSEAAVMAGVCGAGVFSAMGLLLHVPALRNRVLSRLLTAAYTGVFMWAWYNLFLINQRKSWYPFDIRNVQSLTNGQVYNWDYFSKSGPIVQQAVRV